MDDDAQIQRIPLSDDKRARANALVPAIVAEPVHAAYEIIGLRRQVEQLNLDLAQQAVNASTILQLQKEVAQLRKALQEKEEPQSLRHLGSAH